MAGGHSGTQHHGARAGSSVYRLGPGLWNCGHLRARPGFPWRSLKRLSLWAMPGAYARPNLRCEGLNVSRVKGNFNATPPASAAEGQRASVSSYSSGLSSRAVQGAGTGKVGGQTSRKERAGAESCSTQRTAKKRTCRQKTGKRQQRQGKAGLLQVGKAGRRRGGKRRGAGKGRGK